jgi:histidinol-phosphate aminotransferase
VGSQAVVDLLNRVRQPFNVNNLALAAASAALKDQEFLNESFELNQRGMAQILAGLKTLKLESLPSYGNFITFKVADAAGVNRRLLKQGVIVRPLAGYNMPDYLRVTIGREHENARFLEALEKAIRG